ncbi:MAG: hypothetical protein WBL63_21225 [Candidatus Acidiferrum sp.]
MNKSHTGTDEKSAARVPLYPSGSEVQHLLGAEEHILQSISDRAPLPEILNGICRALDGQIGNVVSFISFPGDDASELAAIALSAALFDLYAFCSESIVAENNELLGSLEMYCNACRSPSSKEFQLIRRATCLISIAIKMDNEADHRGECDVCEKQSARERQPE